MKYVYCTVAVGDRYYKSAVKFAKDLNKKTKDHHVLIVTDQKLKKIKNTTFLKLPKEELKFYPNGCFNYNLKYFPIKCAIDLKPKFILFFDSDWIIDENYHQEKIDKFLNFFEISEYDFIFERPHGIGESKKDWNNCFWRHKIEPYKLMETDFYDKGHVCNEQFLAFKNNKKLKIFVKAWKKRNNFSIENNIWPFAEGLEIGMSSIDAEMNFTIDGMYLLNSCFKFYSNSSDIPLTRF
jgi:hypothetical protein